MARNEKKLRGIFEMPPDSGIFYIQYFDINGNRRREKVGRRSDAITLLAKRKTEKLQGKKLPENLRKRAVPFKELLDDALEILSLIHILQRGSSPRSWASFHSLTGLPMNWFDRPLSRGCEKTSRLVKS